MLIIDRIGEPLGFVCGFDGLLEGKDEIFRVVAAKIYF